MMIWVVRFIPYQGGANLDLFFRSGDKARAVRDRILGSKSPEIWQDDFGVEIIVDATRCAVILTDSTASAAAQFALNNANQHAAQTYATPGIVRGSSLQ